MPPSSSSSSSSSAYSFKPGGSLKFKGGESVQTVSKKKRKSKSSTSLAVREMSSASSSRRDADKAVARTHDEQEDGESTEADRLLDATESGRPMTDAERKFEAIRRKRMEQRVAKEAKLSHKDRVDQFNKSLVERTEHNDMLTVSGH